MLNNFTDITNVASAPAILLSMCTVAEKPGHLLLLSAMYAQVTNLLLELCDISTFCNHNYRPTSSILSTHVIHLNNDDGQT